MLRLPSFTYLQPKTLKEALAMKSDAGPDGMYVAGGTDLYPNMKRRHQEPRTVISLMGIPELRAGGRSAGRPDGGVVLGSCITLTELSASPPVRQSARAVGEAAALVSTPLLRNMGTLGGNLCLDTRCNYYDQTYEWRKAIDFCMKKDGHICWVAPSSPRCWAVTSSDLAPVMVALGAEYLLAGPAGERVVPAARFYHNDGINYLTKQPDEMLVEVRLPPPAASGAWDAVYHKLRRRGSFDFPVLGVAAWVRGEGEGEGDGDRVADARVGLGGVASWPQEMPEAATARRGPTLAPAGGRVEAGDTIRDLMRCLSPRVRMVGTGWVASIAALIYVAVPREDRFCLPNTRFLLHQPAGGAGGSASDIEIEAREILKMRDRLNREFAQQTGQPLERIEEDTRRNFWLTAEEARRYGLVEIGRAHV